MLPVFRAAACALAIFGWAGLGARATAQERTVAPSVTPGAIVSAIDACISAFPTPKFDATVLAEPRWHSKNGVMADGTKLSVLVRDDGTVLSIGDRGCIVKSPLAAGSSVDDLASALTVRFASQPRRAGGDLRWSVPPGFVQIHRQNGTPDGAYFGVIVQVHAVADTH